MPILKAIVYWARGYMREVLGDHINAATVATKQRIAESENACWIQSHYGIFGPPTQPNILTCLSTSTV